MLPEPPRVVSALPQNRLAAAKGQFLKGWQVRYLADYEGGVCEEILADTLREAGFLLKELAEALGVDEKQLAQAMTSAWQQVLDEARRP